MTVDGSKLAQARSDANLTQVEVSHHTGIHPRAIGRYEKNISNPPVTTLQVLASLYGRPAGSFTPQGQFSLEEQQIFDGVTTIAVSPPPNKDPVLVAYAMSEPFLTEPAKQRIANFILFTFQQVSKSLPKNTRIELTTHGATSAEYEEPPLDITYWTITFPPTTPEPLTDSADQQTQAYPAIHPSQIVPEATSANFDDEDEPDEPSAQT